MQSTFDHRVVLQAAQKQWHRWKWDKAALGPKLPWKRTKINEGLEREVVKPSMRCDIRL